MQPTVDAARGGGKAERRSSKLRSCFLIFLKMDVERVWRRCGEGVGSLQEGGNQLKATAKALTK
eukprot:350982-Chlamydomonas_euryale.AAC.2